MIKKFENQDVDASFFLADSNDVDKVLGLAENHLKFFWNTGKSDLELKIDDRIMILEPQQVLCSTYLHKIQYIDKGPAPEITLLTFNRAFYCIHTNDAEVSCNGLLFFGSNYLPVITLDVEEAGRLGTLIAVLKDEFDTIDRNQEEMLRILLKRYIIRCTRLARKQLVKKDLPDVQLDIIRKFTVLVEEHFKTFRHVADYANMMHRSPKTITNIFSLQSDKSPLQIIHDRLILEAKRLLLYTEKSSKEIAVELGFEEPAQFSRFYKKQVGLTPQEFKEKNRLG